jgi:hypothetical protein
MLIGVLWLLMETTGGIINFKIIKIGWFFGFSGLTIYPLIFNVSLSGWGLKHEKIHLEQQHKWYSVLWYFGVLAWLFCYLMILPVGWNPFRYKWEYEAYKNGQGYSDMKIREVLKKEYFLWLH